jgi:hypothetical protein
LFWGPNEDGTVTAFGRTFVSEHDYERWCAEQGVHWIRLGWGGAELSGEAQPPALFAPRAEAAERESAPV